MAATTHINDVATVSGTSAELVAVPTNASFLAIVNEGPSIIYLGFGADATTGGMPIAGSATSPGVFLVSGDAVAPFRGMSIKAVTASGSNTKVHRTVLKGR